MGHLPNWASSSNVSFNLAQRPNDLKQLNDSVWEFFKPPPDRDGIAPKVEILFFHGAQLSQDTESFWKTWLSRDERVVWPTAWLAQEFPEARMLFISYDSSVRKAAGSSRQKDVYQTIENLMHDVIWSSTCKAGQKCPVIFVGHCFGGILIKQFLIKCCAFVSLRNAEDSRVKEVNRLLQHCKAIFYYSPPNAGSGMVDALNLADKILRNFNQPMVDFLKTLSPNTARINVEFSNLRHNRKWKSVGIGETWKTTLSDGTMTMVVPEASARHDLDHVYWANADYFDVARAINNYSCITYTGLRDMIRDILEDILSSSTSTCCHLKSDPYFKPGLQLFNDERCGMSFRQSNPVYVENTMPCPLPFGKDNKYVPIVSSIQKVQRALESAECGVVTLHGEAGLGKTSLAKYIALQYWPHRRPQGSGEASSSAVFPDGVFFLDCGQGAERSIKGLQKELLQILGCPLEAVPVNIPEERDGDFLTIPTLKRGLQFQLRNLRALIILDDVWDRPVIQELILSLDEAISIKYLLTSQITDIWPDAVRIEMERPTREEARQIVLKYTNGLSKETSFPKNTEGIVDTMIKTLHFHPLTLAHLGLGFWQEGREPEAWRTVRDSWNHEMLIKGFNKPVIYGREYPLTLPASMTRVMHSLEGSARDLLFLICALKGLRVSEAAVQYLYKCANEGNGNGYRYARNHLQNRSLVHIHRYPGSGSELVIHGLRSLCVTAKSPREVRDLIKRVLQPVMEMYEHLRAQTTVIGTFFRRVLQPVRQLFNYHNAQGMLIPTRYLNSAYVNDGLFNAIMVTRFVKKDFLDLTTVEIPRGVDFNLDGLVKAANVKMLRLNIMVEMSYSDANGEGWKQEAAACAKKIVVRFACRDELDDESMGRLIQLPEAQGKVLLFLRTMFGGGYWYTQFLEHKKTFSSGHPQIVTNLFTLVHDDAEMSRMLFAFQDHYPDELVDLVGVGLVRVLFGGYWFLNDEFKYGMLEYENDDTIVRFGERLIRWALGTSATMSSEFLSKQRFPSSPSRAFRVIQKKIPGLWKMMLALYVQEHISPNQKFIVLSKKINVPADSLTYSRCHSTTLLDRLCNIADPLLQKCWDYPINASIVEWLTSREENREKTFECAAIMSRLIGKLVDIAVMEEHEWTQRSEPDDKFVVSAVGVLLNLALSQKLRLSILSTYPQVVETLERLERRLELEESYLPCISQALGVFKASSVHSQMPDYSSPARHNGHWAILVVTLEGYYNTEMYEEFLAIMERDVFPTAVKEAFMMDMKKEFMYHIIVAKALVKRYQSALVDADANVRYSRQHRTSLVHSLYRCDLEADVVTAVALGLRGMVRLLTRVRENLPEALADFDEAAHLLSKLSIKRIHLGGLFPANFYLPYLPRRATDQYWTAKYYMLKQRGYTKHLMKDDVGAREDATKAEQLQHSSLARDMSSMTDEAGMLRHHDRIFGPTSLLLGRPLTYLGFEFTF